MRSRRNPAPVYIATKHAALPQVVKGSGSPVVASGARYKAENRLRCVLGRRLGAGLTKRSDRGAHRAQA